MKKIISSVTVCAFLTGPVHSVFAEFCKPKITKEMISEVADQGIFQNTEDGFNLDLVTLDHFVRNQHYKKLYDPLISKLIRDQAIQDEKRLDAKELKDAAFQNLKNAYVGPFKVLRDWWYNEETSVSVPIFVAHDEKYLRKKVEELDTENELTAQMKDAIVKDLIDGQAEFIKEKEETTKKAYEKIGTGKKMFYTGGIGAIGASTGRYIGKKISEETAKKILEKGAEAIVKNSAGYVIGCFTGAGLVLAVAGGAYKLYSDYNYAAASLLEENYTRKSIDIAYARDNVKIAKEKLKDAMKEGLWIGTNAFYSVVSNDPKCKLTPISMFRKIDGLPEPDSQAVLPALAQMTCKMRGYKKNTKKCRDFLVKEIDSCVRQETKNECPTIFDVENEDIFGMGDL